MALLHYHKVPQNGECYLTIRLDYKVAESRIKNAFLESSIPMKMICEGLFISWASLAQIRLTGI